MNFKDPDGFTYKYPGRQCLKCLNYPCVDNMDNLVGNFAAYGCKNFSDENTFDLCKK